MLNWNTTNAGADSILIMFEYIDQVAADVIGLSEVNYGQIGVWRKQFEKRGYQLVAHQSPIGTLGSAIASKLPVTPFDDLFAHKANPQVTVSANVSMLGQEVGIHAVYAPPDANKIKGITTVKPSILQAVADAVEVMSGPQIITGDFNTPQYERPDGTWGTWAENFSIARNEWYVIEGEKHRDYWREKHKAELAISKPRADMRCAFRNSKREGSPETSWHGQKNKFRLDHIICSEDIMPSSVWYDEFYGKSNHRPMLAEWNPLPPPSQPSTTQQR